MSGGAIFKTPQGERAVKAHYDALLARWPLPWHMTEVATRLGPTSVLSCGAPGGQPLVLLHGAASNAVMWMGEVERLARRHRLFAVDVIGEPGRSAQVRPAWEGPAYSDWLSDVLEGLGLRTIRLMGLSQGGWIALKFAVTRPRAIEKLVLLSPAGVVRDRVSFLLRVLPLLLLGGWGRRRASRMVAHPQPIHPEALRFMELLLSHLRPRTDPAPLFEDGELLRLSMPVLLVGGEQDVVRDCRAIAHRLRDLVPRLETRLLPDHGHALMNVAPLVAPFLEE